MNTIENILKKKNNIAIIGQPGSGKTILLGSLLPILVNENKKVLMLEPLGEKEYEKITANLGGKYLVYDTALNIDYDSKLTTISFSTMNNRPTIVLILNLIKEAENKGVDVVLIDEAFDYLKECEKLSDNVHVQLIVNTMDTHMLDGENGLYFKKLFTTIFLMKLDKPSINLRYLSLLSLYNVEKLVIDYLETIRPQQYFENIVIQDMKILRKI
jgi:GTPase SAR1 family protein